MIGSGEAESRAVSEAVHRAIGQARLDAGAHITGLLAANDRPEGVHYRQQSMCSPIPTCHRPACP